MKQQSDVEIDDASNSLQCLQTSNYDDDNTIDLEIANVGSDVLQHQLFLEHDTFEPQIPSHISIICVFTAHFYLISGIMFLFAHAIRFIMLGVVLIILYLSSVNFWRHPHFVGWSRIIDLLMVVTTVAYSTYCASTLPGIYPMYWYITISTVLLMFTINEVSS